MANILTTEYKFILFLMIACAIWILYDIWLVSKNKSLFFKILWSFFGIFLAIPTAITYWFMFKRQKVDFFKK